MIHFSFYLTLDIEINYKLMKYEILETSIFFSLLFQLFSSLSFRSYNLSLRISS